ncbi:hypothetical protein DB346_19645 [Verrucomicrobia bacterium LW23]|nr:hypothetical protein DB346_19645 [Verrucomicrobia bacterium LW23]
MPSPFEPLRAQFLQLAQEFSTDARPLADLLGGIVADVERACAEPLEMFPVKHHSPAAALHLLKRLRERPPQVIFMEGCEDMQREFVKLGDCRLPVAIQAFAAKVDYSNVPPVEGRRVPSGPLSLVLPLTEFSAEFQAIAYAHATGTPLRMIDRTADHVFQWTREPEYIAPEETDASEEPAADEAKMHGGAVGVQLGELRPTFPRFVQVLLQKARVQHYSEWWEQYVEQPLFEADFETYRQVLFMIGSLVRRLGQNAEDKIEDELRERYMWTRIKTHLRATGISPRDAIYICGAAHTASHVQEFGAASPTLWDVPPVSATEWLYGVLPSSYASIERQFGMPPGAVSLAEAMWKRQLSLQQVQSYKIDAKSATPSKAKPKKSAATPPPIPASAGAAAGPENRLQAYLATPPAPLPENHDELLQWSTQVTSLARKDGYMASTADSIAIYQTSVLLAHLRNRHHPTPYDFRDAAITCLEKERVPKKRDIRKICEILLGGDRIGKIGYNSLPPLAQNIYDRLRVLPVNLEARTIQRALLDLRANPQYRPCSELLWKLRYLVPPAVRPIMGQLVLGQTSEQESWDLALGKFQGELVQLAYEGITVESVLERRLTTDAYAPDATTAVALDVVEKCLLLMRSERLAEDFGERATHLLVTAENVSDAPDVYARTQKLVHYYRGTPEGVPPWLGNFVQTGYRHYCAQLPHAFTDRGVKPEDLASMLRFIFTLESLALSFGCQRSELLIAVRQAAATEDPVKLGLLWCAENVLQLRRIAELRAYFDNVLSNELLLPRLPEYLSGFLLGLTFAPGLTGFTVELLSRTFAELPEPRLMPWLPQLFRVLRTHGAGSLPILVKEAAAVFPRTLADLQAWTPAWEAKAPPAAGASIPAGEALATTPHSPEGAEAAPVVTSPQVAAAGALLSRHPATARAIAALLGLD